MPGGLRLTGRTAAPAAVFVMHKQAMIREGVRSLLHRLDGLRVASECADVALAVQRLRTHTCDLLLVQLGGEGIQLARALLRLEPAARVVFMGSGQPATPSLLAALELGVDVYVDLDDPDDLMRGVAAAQAGQPYLCPRWGPAVVRECSTRKGEVPLSDRERQILASLRPERALVEVAHGLGLSISTVKSHLNRIYRKLGVNNRAAAERHAVAAGLTFHQLGT